MVFIRWMQFMSWTAVRVEPAEDAPDGDTTPIRVPASLVSALAITVALTIAFGVYPPLVSEFDVTLLAGGLGG